MGNGKTGSQAAVGMVSLVLAAANVCAVSAEGAQMPETAGITETVDDADGLAETWEDLVLPERKRSDGEPGHPD